MDLIDVLYLPTGKDVAQGLFVGRYIERISQSVAAAVIQTNLAPCPADQMRLIYGIGLELLPGAAQTFLGANIIIRDIAGGIGIAQPGAVLQSSPAAAAATRCFASWSGQFLQFANEQITVEAYFNAGVAANSVAFGIAGLYMPRGNVRS
jgi:hypothetical protein